MISELSTTLLNPSELSTTAGRLVNIARNVAATEPFIQKNIDLILQDIRMLEEVMSRDRNSEYTTQLLKKDEERDAAFIALRDYAKACTNHRVPAMNQAGEFINAIIKKYGWTLYSLGYTQESAQLALLFNDLDTPEATAALKTVGAESWYADLKAAQQTFEETFTTKMVSDAKEDYPYLREAKTKLSRHLNVLLSAMSILEELDGDGNLAAIINPMNEVINSIMTTVRARKTRTEKVENNAS
ncbi:hypothetical protein JW964_22535 [candidate division KSB1 bacterium]|nr:hypothetical protein [candidate division KSB1 bacterium]